MTLLNTPDIKDILTVRRNVIVVFADTTGFSNFVRRTSDQPQIHRDYLLALYRRTHEYQKAFRCFLKRECDGAMFVHEYDDKPDPIEVVRILKAVEELQSDCAELVHAVPYPRPDGFRCRTTMGLAWKMTVLHDSPVDCDDPSCPALSEYDYWEYATILASRIIDVHKETANACCQTIKEATGPTTEICFTKLPPERRTPKGVFREDMQDIWSFRSQ